MQYGVEQIFPSMELERELKSSENSSVCLVHDKAGKSYIYRWFLGTDEVYLRLREIGCPYLPKIYDVKSQGDRVFVLEEYIAGDTLAFLLEAGPLKPAWVRRISMQLCQALNQLHRAGIVHRDVKPENILLRGNDAVLIDFDASRIAKPKGDTDTHLLGTAGYAAPEQYGFSQTDQRADIYSMGIVINEMLTGEHPSKQLVGGKFKHVVERCIEVNMDRRFQNAEALALAIRTCRSRWMWVAALAATAVLVVGGLAWAFQGGQAQMDMPSATMEAQTKPVVQPQERADTILVEEEPWQGEVNLAMPSFTYDLDQDGETESYLFGIYHANLPEHVCFTNSDYFALDVGQVQYRDVSPCVWKNQEDGTLTMVPEFADLLQDASVQLWRMSDETQGTPKVVPQTGLWPGGVAITFSSEDLGDWLYHIQATLDGTQLTAQAVSTVDTFENYQKIMGQING